MRPIKVYLPCNQSGEADPPAENIVSTVLRTINVCRLTAWPRNIHPRGTLGNGNTYCCSVEGNRGVTALELLRSAILCHFKGFSTCTRRPGRYCSTSRNRLHSGHWEGVSYPGELGPREKYTLPFDGRKEDCRCIVGLTTQSPSAASKGKHSIRLSGTITALLLFVPPVPPRLFHCL